jgi:hypothetical protein
VGGTPPLGPRTLPPDVGTEPRRDNKALCLSAVELTGAEVDAERAGSFKDGLEVATAGFV